MGFRTDDCNNILIEMGVDPDDYDDSPLMVEYTGREFIEMLRLAYDGGYVSGYRRAKEDK